MRWQNRSLALHHPEHSKLAIIGYRQLSLVLLVGDQPDLIATNRLVSDQHQS